MNSSTTPKIKKADPAFLSKSELRFALNLPSNRMIDAMMQARKIPYIKLGHRTVRFSLEKVLAALGRLETKAVGDR